MKIVERHLLILLALATCLGSARPLAAQPLPDRRPLVGRVVTSRGIAIPGAAVAVQRTDWGDTDGAMHSYYGSRSVTDEKGEFSIPQAENGLYSVLVDAEGFGQGGQTVLLDEATQPLRIVLERLSTLKLVFQKPDGSLLASTKLKIYLRGPGSSSLPWLQTNTAGAAQVNALAPGNYSLRVMAFGIGAASIDTLTLKEGMEQPITVRLERGGTLVAIAKTGSENNVRAVGGALLSFARMRSDEAGPPPASFSEEATLYGAVHDRASLISRDGDGRVYVVDLQPGRYAVRFYAPDFESSPQQIVEIKAGAETTATLLLKPQIALAEAFLLLTDAQKEPLANMDLWFQVRPATVVTEKAMLEVTPGGGDDDALAPPPAPGMPVEANTGAPGGVMRRAVTDADGRIVVYPLRPGHWRAVFYEPRSAQNDARAVALGGGDFETAPRVAISTITLKLP